MDNRIFKLGLSVEAVSLYILLDYFDESGKEISLKAVRPKWNSSESILLRSLEELELQGVILQRKGDCVTLASSSAWRGVSGGNQ